jgi:hypothetical protein
MAANKRVTLPPVALTATTTANIYSPPTLTGGTNVPEASTNAFYTITHIHVGNTTASAIQFALWLDATGGNTAGKEVIAPGVASGGALTRGVSVAAQSVFDWYGALRISAADTNKFLVGGASAVGLTIQAEAEIGVV